MHASVTQPFFSFYVFPRSGQAPLLTITGVAEAAMGNGRIHLNASKRNFYLRIDIKKNVDICILQGLQDYVFELRGYTIKPFSKYVSLFIYMQCFSEGM